MIHATAILCSSTLVLLVLVVPARGAVRNFAPVDPWCEAINKAAPGDEIVLSAGSYSTPCLIEARGAAGAPIVVRSANEDPLVRAVLAYSGTLHNVLELRGVQYLTLRWLSFGPTRDGVDAIKIRRSSDVLVEQNLFYRISGVSISANDGDTQRITVRKNVLKDLTSTALYFGCHEGLSCHATDLTIDGNLIDGVWPLDGKSVGYGLQIKLNSFGLVRDNTVYRTRGPGIMVYGSNRGDPASVVEGNYVEGSRTDGGIVIGGGPAIVRNNVVVGNAGGGISAQNYGGRNLQQNVWIVHNTSIDNATAGVIVAGWRRGDGNVVAFNAIAPRRNTPALLPALPRGTIRKNVTCKANPSCFVTPTGPVYDLRPALSGPLVDGGKGGSAAWRPIDDFMGVRRERAADVGAFEQTAADLPYAIGGGKPRPVRVVSLDRPHKSAD